MKPRASRLALAGSERAVLQETGGLVHSDGHRHRTVDLHRRRLGEHTLPLADRPLLPPQAHKGHDTGPFSSTMSS